MQVGIVYRGQGKLGTALQMHEWSLKMSRNMHGQDNSHPDIAVSLWSIALVFIKQKKLDQAAELLSQGVEMLRNVHGRNSVHPHITAVLLNLADGYDNQGRLTEALAAREQITQEDIVSNEGV